MKDVQSAWEAFRPQNRTSNSSKHEISSHSYIFGVIFPSRIRIKPAKINADPCVPTNKQLWIRTYTDKKEHKIFLIYKEIQMGSVQSHIWERAS